MAVIKKKAWPMYFEAVLSGKKRFDVRLNDVPLAEGDTLVLEEWDPTKQQPTGRMIEKKVTFVMTVKPGESFWPEEAIRTKGLIIASLE